MDVTTHFHPVGQGLFSTGEIEYGGDKFRWIYDCGTTSSQKLLHNSVEDVRHEWGGDKPQVDLVVLSHFDYDHISGLLYLLARFKVKTLLLPHVPLEQRLVHAFQQGVGRRSRVLRFMLNPAGYLGSLEAAVEQVLMVLPGGRRGPDNNEPQVGQDPENNDQREERLGPLQADVLGADSLDSDLWADLGLAGAPAGSGAVQSSTPLRVGTDWEFVPYNDGSLMPKTPARFARLVRKERDALLAHPSKATLDALKKVYDDEFKATSAGRNIVSLFLYAGSRQGNRWSDWEFTILARQDGTRRWAHHHGYHHGDEQRAGFLYTGDGYLDTPLRLEQYVRHLGSDRLQGSNCLQVMHHGSRRNWHAGVAEVLKPMASIFSSNPNHRKYQHPHGEVVRDFLPFHPLQVDADRWASIYLMFR